MTTPTPEITAEDWERAVRNCEIAAELKVEILRAEGVEALDPNALLIAFGAIRESARRLAAARNADKEKA